MQPDRLLEQLRDERSRKVVFVSHCLLNQNTRYLGGAFRPGAVGHIVQPYLDAGVGLVQLPCPEQRVWGGVLKRFLWPLYGRGALARLLGRLLLPYVRLRYRRLARQVARDIDDYLRSGFEVVGVLGVAGSPSCGVRTTVDARGFIDDASRVAPAGLSAEGHEAMVERHTVPGQGMFIAALRQALRARGRTRGVAFIEPAWRPGSSRPPEEQHSPASGVRLRSLVGIKRVR